jgi:hypothetical protein
MECWILRSLSLKSDGHLCGDDSSGFACISGEFPPSLHGAYGKSFKGRCGRIFATPFRLGSVSWPGTCDARSALGRRAPDGHIGDEY